MIYKIRLERVIIISQQDDLSIIYFIVDVSSLDKIVVNIFLSHCCKYYRESFSSNNKLHDYLRKIYKKLNKFNIILSITIFDSDNIFIIKTIKVINLSISVVVFEKKIFIILSNVNSSKNIDIDYEYRE